MLSEVNMKMWKYVVVVGLLCNVGIALADSEVGEVRDCHKVGAGQIAINTKDSKKGTPVVRSSPSVQDVNAASGAGG